ncbi:MAG TPA: peptidoglycan bridge formation glycyltransferase FemA/FemB family protein, partial [Candidatus Peregrinibacteria bacterium]|nr:peptidoglycan bridge formation glycyltransferase FemA/FemB family protein [Candidatus Peregrinibacteria bacterium]
LIKTTTERDRFSGHSLEIYQKMLEKLGNQASLLLAEYQGKITSGGIFTFYGKTAVYYYGASGNEHREVMAPYLVQWEAIQMAKEKGCRVFDFLGIAPPDTKNHSWKGITEFKKKFGGKEVGFPAPQDIVYQPAWYQIFRAGKRLRQLF